MKRISWSICRSGALPSVLDDLRSDVSVIQRDLVESERKVPEALMRYIESTLEVIGTAGHVRVLAFSTGADRGFSADIAIRPRRAG